MVELDYRAAYSLKHLLFAFYPHQRSVALRTRGFYSTLVRAWIRPKAAIEDSVATHVSYIGMQMSNIVGVHYRASDTGRGFRLLDSYFVVIDHYLRSHPNTSIFLATGDAHAFTKFSERYGTLLKSQRHVSRAFGKESIWKGGQHAFDKGAQVLVDSLLLSKCAFLVKSQSQVSEYAILFEPSIPNFDFSFDTLSSSVSIHQQKSTQWTFVSLFVFMVSHRPIAVLY